MADHPRFGPAGVPPSFKLMNASLLDVPKFLRNEDLDAFEYEAVRWGKKPQIRETEARNLGLEAKQNDVWLSLHGSYFMNFCGNEQIREASKERLVACAKAATWMKAHIIVFHPGFYGKRSHREAFDLCSKTLSEITSTLSSMGVNDVMLGPETMGRIYQLGTLDEVLALCENVEHTQPVIDWSHLHARNQGCFQTVADFRDVVENIESKLGADAAKNLHCHFTKIEFTRHGEKSHHILVESKYGPDFELLAKVIADFKLKPVIISESPLLDIDAIKMRDILRKEWSKS